HRVVAHDRAVVELGDRTSLKPGEGPPPRARVEGRGGERQELLVHAAYRVPHGRRQPVGARCPDRPPRAELHQTGCSSSTMSETASSSPTAKLSSAIRPTALRSSSASF